MRSMFGCDIRRSIRAIYKNMELLESDTMRYIRQGNGISYDVYSLEMVIAGISYDVYSLEMVIAVAFKLRTKECMAFRRFVMGKLYAANRKEPLYLFFSPAAYSRNSHSC